MAKNNNRNPRNRQTTKPEEVKLPVEDFMAEDNAEEEISEPEVNEEEETSESEVLEETSTTEDDEETPVLKAKITKCNKLRLRTGASTGSPVDRILEADNVLTLSSYDPKAEWTEVEAVDDVPLDTARFVMTQFIEVL